MATAAPEVACPELDVADGSSFVNSVSITLTSRTPGAALFYFFTEGDKQAYSKKGLFDEKAKKPD